MSYSSQPTPAEKRLTSLDVLRGVAVLGILVMNVYAFAMPWIAYANPLAMGGSDPLNLSVWFASHVLFDQKFMSIFSMLFGAGIVLMSERAERRGKSFTAIFYRRQFWLLLIGAAHGYLIWFGDILFHYALVGMLVYLLRNGSPRKLLLIGCCLLPVAPLLSYGGGITMQDLKAQADALELRVAAGETLDEEEQATIDEWVAQRGFIVPGNDELQQDLVAYRGGYSQIVRHRASFVAMFQVQGFVFFTVWRIGALMLIGMALMKLGIMGGQRSAGFYRKLMLAGYLFGLPLTVFSAANLYAHEFDALYTFKIGGLANYVGSILVALGHIGLVMSIVSTGRFRSLCRRLAAVGRMAFTNYLMQSLVMTTVFYGYGFGLYGSVSRSVQMLMVAAVFAAQLMLSAWWLERYRFGPAEWLWRRLSYGQPQPFRRPA